MSDDYTLPLVGDHTRLTNRAMMSATDAHMRRPAESAPTLHQLLPGTNHVEPPYTVAGLDSGPTAAPYRHTDHDADPSRSVTALYTPDGSCNYQERVLACRLNYIDDDHAHSDDIDAYHETKLDDEFEDGEREAYTDWTDSNFTQNEVNGFKRTVFTLRKPILSAHTPGQRTATRPVLVTAFVLQTTPWGVIETGTYHWPNPDPGDARDTVTSLADTVTNRADRLPRPTTDDQWSLFYGHDLSQAELVTAMETTIAERADEPNDMKTERGAVLTYLLDQFQEEYGVTRREARGTLAILDEQGHINDNATGLIKLT